MRQLLLCYYHNRDHLPPPETRSYNLRKTMNEKAFGLLLRDLRIEAGFGLRSFAKKIRMKPSNLSFIENGRTPPPRDNETLKVIATALGLKKNSPEIARFFDAAVEDVPGRLPADILANRTLADQVPIMLRTVANARLKASELKELINRIRTFRPKP